MRLRTALFAATLTSVFAAALPPARAQQPTTPVAASIPVDPADVIVAAKAISQRSEHLGPIFSQVHPEDWVAKGAPDTYARQWTSLEEQNQAIQTDMTGIARLMEAKQNDANSDVPLMHILQALFRVHRFESDLADLVLAVRRYQNPAVGDLIESVSAGSQPAVEKLQQYSSDLADEKDRQLALVDREAQRCRAMLATQPSPARPYPPKKTSAGTNK